MSATQLELVESKRTGLVRIILGFPIELERDSSPVCLFGGREASVSSFSLTACSSSSKIDSLTIEEGEEGRTWRSEGRGGERGEDVEGGREGERGGKEGIPITVEIQYICTVQHNDMRKRT